MNFGRYIYVRLPFRAAPEQDIFLKKGDDPFEELLNVFGIANDILAVGYDKGSTDDDTMLHIILQICRKK